MQFTLLDINSVIQNGVFYPDGKPYGAKMLRFLGTDIYVIFHHKSLPWTKDEFTLLKEYAFYHLSAPCYQFDRKDKVLLSLERITRQENFLYVIAYLFSIYRIDVF